MASVRFLIERKPIVRRAVLSGGEEAKAPNRCRSAEFAHLTMPGGVLQWAFGILGIRRMRNDTTQRRGRSGLTPSVRSAPSTFAREPPTAPSDRAAPGPASEATPEPRTRPAARTFRNLASMSAGARQRPARSPSRTLCVLPATETGRGGPGGAESPGFRVEAADLTKTS